MSQYNAQNVTVNINGSNILATSATISASKSVQAIRTLGNSLAQGLATTGPTETTISIEYVLENGVCPIKSISDAIIANPVTWTTNTPATLIIGSLTINKCHLTSYTVSAEANSIVTANASFIAYSKDRNLSNFNAVTPVVSSASKVFGHGGGTTLTTYARAIGFNYENSFDWQPLILLGKAGDPENGFLFNGGTQSLVIRGIGIGDSVTYCTQTKTASATVGTTCGGGVGTTFSITNGDITSVELSNSVGGFQEGSITISKQF